MKKNLLTFALYFGIVLMGNFIAYQVIHVPSQMSLTIILAALAFYPILRNPAIGVYVVFAVTPFIPLIRKLYYLAFARPKLDPLIMFSDIILAITFVGLYFEFKERKERDSSISWFTTIVTVYLLYLVLRTATTSPLSEAIATFKNYGPAVLFFFVGIVFALRTAQLVNVLRITAIVGVIATLYGLKQLFFGYSEAEQIWFSSISFSTLFIQGIARPFSIFQAPVAFADYLQMATIAVFVLSVWSNKASGRIWLILLPFFFWGSLITSVRSNWIGMVLSFFLWFVYLRLTRTSHRVILITLSILGYIVVSFLFDKGAPAPQSLSALSQMQDKSSYVNLLITSRAAALSNPLEEHSLLSRIDLWQMIVRTSADPLNALWGRGIGSLNADSLYFTYLAEFGYPGMVLIVMIIGSFIFRGLRSLKTMTRHHSIVLVKAVVVLDIVLACASLTGTHIHYFHGDIFFWFWNGVMVKLTSDQFGSRGEG